MAARVYPQRKQDYIARMNVLIDTHTKVFVVQADHVGSKQFQDIRLALRGHGTVLMGKNTVMRKVIADRGADHPYTALLGLLVGNIGLVFVKENMAKVSSIIGDYVVPAPAKAGVIANANVVVPPGPTGCDPSQTSYFQAMEIPTKIARGQIEISTSVHLIEKGDRVTAGQADLLSKLDIRPFVYGLGISMVFDNGSLFDEAVLNITQESIWGAFSIASRDVAAVGHALNKPNTVSATHSVDYAFKLCLAIVVNAGFAHKFDQAADVLGYLADPSAFVAAGPAAGAAPAESAAVIEEVEEEADADAIVMNLGGDDDDEAW